MSTETESFPPDPGAETDLLSARERDCPFCKRIAAGEYDYHDAYAVAFQPLNPVTPGHFLVVPQIHVTEAAADPSLAGHAMELAAELAGQMELEDYNLITSAGPVATQTVWHLHIHVVPRREGDGLQLPWTGQREGLVTVARDDLGVVLSADWTSAEMRGALERIQRAVAAVTP